LEGSAIPSDVMSVLGKEGDDFFLGVGASAVIAFVAFDGFVVIVGAFVGWVTLFATFEAADVVFLVETSAFLGEAAHAEDAILQIVLKTGGGADATAVEDVIEHCIGVLRIVVFIEEVIIVEFVDDLFVVIVIGAGEEDACEQAFAGDLFSGAKVVVRSVGFEGFGEFCGVEGSPDIFGSSDVFHEAMMIGLGGFGRALVNGNHVGDGGLQSE
jgi:hypothetical protein